MRIAVFIAALAAAAQCAMAQSAVVKTNTAVKDFVLKSAYTTVPGRGEDLFTVVNVGNYRVSFLPPNGCAVTAKADQRKITFAPTSNRFALSVRFAEGLAPGETEMKQKMPTLYPGGVVAETGYAMSRIGQAHYRDVRREFKNGSVLRTRHGILPYSGGYLEIDYTSDETSFDNFRATFTWLLNTIEVDPRPAGE
jgi:hypothetical protein